ncbi:hypothetical protein Afil01_14750 [Actinorhabdospora filicis]|uniref:Zn-dependent metalloprotease n=1 Tax=Actinorhabdospora filicis TaxID=1785913 RepID=A0A9W6SI20_9ACTN|nr:M4 family metallopeptidase [Actinorhabdospora filicis]GLZ76668.1 hypothetical protein Afil01_14750 [Actinorhabdospora filicis]
MSRSRARLLAMTTAACAAAALAVAAPAQADEGIDPSAVTPGTGTEAPARVMGDEQTVAADEPVAAARQYLDDNQRTFAIDGGDLTPIATYADGATETVRFAQSHQGVPVFGAQYLVHMRPDGGDTTVTGANGTYYTGLSVDTAPAATEATAVDRAKQYVLEGLAGGKFTVPATGPDVAAASRGLVVLPEGAGRLSWHVTVSTVDGKGTPVVKEVYVDADTAWPLFAYDGIQFDSPAAGTGVKYDGTESPIGVTKSDDGTYKLVDQANAPTDITTYDGRGWDVRSVLGGGVPEGMPIYSGPSTRFDGDATESGAVDAHVNAAHVYEYYLKKLGRNGLDGNGMDMTSVVGVDLGGQPFVNAFWDGTKMVYGSGGGDFKTLSADLDVVGHEMTHGVVEHSAGLIYAHQPGAMNEAIADYFGNAIDVDYSGTSMRDPDAGLLGEDLCRTASPRECALRDLNDGRTTADYEGLTWEFDNGGVHANSTIFSGALWDIRERIGGAKADKLIYKALTEYLTPTSSFVDGRNAVVQAALDSRLSWLERGKVLVAFLQHGIVDGWEKRIGDASQLMTGITTERTAPAAAGGWWVAAKGSPEGGEPYSMYSGRTSGGKPVKLADPVEGRFNVMPATDGKWAVWIAWGAADALIMRAPVNGSAPAKVVGYARNPSRLSVEGSWISWQESTPSGPKQWYKNADDPNSYEEPVDGTYHKTSGLGEIRGGKLYYVLAWPDSERYHLNVVVRDLATRQETMLPEIMAEGSTTEPAGLYGPKPTSKGIVIGVDARPGNQAGIVRISADGKTVKTLVDEASANAPLLGEYDATSSAVTFENWPGDVPPKIWQVSIDGGKAKPMSCTTGVQFHVNADEGTRAVWFDGMYGTTALVVRDKPRSHC